MNPKKLDIAKQRAKLEKELGEIRHSRELRNKQSQIDSDRWHRIDDELRRLRCLELLNVAGGVVLRDRQPAGSRWAKLNDAAGTLIDVRRTRATVDFGELGMVTTPLDNLLPAAERDLQGHFVTLCRGKI